MADIRFMADMNISPKTVETLRQRGWDIVRVTQFLPVNATDAEIIAFARSEDRVVVTQDLDFSALLALSGHTKPSLITLRLALSDPDTVSRRLLELIPMIKQVLIEGAVVTVEDTATRIRRLPVE